MDQYIGMIAMFGFNFAPVSWVYCDGRLLSISDYSTLYTLIGTTYGGDGVNSFAVPDLRSRVAVGQGPSAGNNYTIGQIAGTEQTTLTVQNLPIHTHSIMATIEEGDTTDPTGAYLAHTGEGDNEYKQAPDASSLQNMNAGVVSPSGSAAPLPFSLLQPALAVNYCIATEGIFPPQS